MYSNRVEDFLKDDRFIHYVLEEAPEVDSLWELHFRDDSKSRGFAEEAKAVLLAPADVKSLFTDADCEVLKNRILSTIKGLD